MRGFPRYIKRWLPGDGWLCIDCEIRVFKSVTVVERGKSFMVKRLGGGNEGLRTWRAMFAGALPDSSDGGGTPSANGLEAISEFEVDL